MYRQKDNDYELLYMIYQKDDESLKLLISKYENIMYLFYQNQDSLMYFIRRHIDAYQIGTILLLKAVEWYRVDKDVSFRHYFLCMLKNEICNTIRRSQMLIHTYNFSVDNIVCEDEEGYLGDVWKETRPSMQADWIVQREEKRNAILSIEKSLSETERKIFRLRLYGYSYNEIIKLLNVKYKKVDNTLCKVRKYKV